GRRGRRAPRSCEPCCTVYMASRREQTSAQHTVREGSKVTVSAGAQTYAPPDPPAMPHPRPGPKRDLRCLDCGYGAVAASDEIRCPMCGGEAWDFAEWRPFSS